MNRLARRTARGRRDGVRYVLTAAACAVASIGAHAGDFSVGVGAGVDRAKVDCVAAYPCDRGSAHAKLFVGYQPVPNVELQALAFDAGHFDGGDTSPLGTPFGGRFKASGVGLAAGYRWGFAPDWSLKGQLGVASVRTRFDYAAPFGGDASETTTQPLLGLSLAWQVAPRVKLSLDYDETRFKVYTTHGSLRMFGLAAQFAF
jgi:hypothetical protein